MGWLRAIHRWAGLAVALPLLAVAVSGGLLLCKGPYLRARHPALAAPGLPPDAGREGAIVDRIIASSAADGVRLIRFPRPGLNAFQVWLANEEQAFIDPAGGAEIARWSPRTSLPAFLFDLHAHLLAGETGETINGILAASVLVFGGTGVILWWPGRRSAFRLRQAWPGRAGAARWLRSHAATGVLVLAPVLLFTGSGALLVFYEPVSSVLSRALDRQPPERPDAVVARRHTAPAPVAHVLAAVRQQFPDGDVVMLYPGTGANAALTFRMRLPGEWHPNGRSYALVDPYTARVVQAIDARRQGAGTRIAHAIYPLHAATVGGWAFGLVAGAAAIGLAWLALSGGLAYVQKLRATARGVRRREAALPGLTHSAAGDPPEPQGPGTRDEGRGKRVRAFLLLRIPTK